VIPHRNEEHAMMTDDARQAIVRRFFEEGWNSGNPALVSDIIDEHYASNDGDEPNNGFFGQAGPSGDLGPVLTGADAFAAHVQKYGDMYNDLRFTIDKMVVDSETVITIWTPSGTTKNRFFADRLGQQRPYELRYQGTSLTDVVQGKVTRHDMFWPLNLLFP
jgi:hypothetical protein